MNQEAEEVIFIINYLIERAETINAGNDTPEKDGEKHKSDEIWKYI